MDNLNKLFYYVFSALIFCIGIYLFIMQLNHYNKALFILRDMQIEKELYVQYQEKDEVVTYAELIGTLLHPLDYNIKINELMITKAGHTLDQISNYGIAVLNYQKSYRYDEQGNVVELVYTQVNS